MDFEVMYGKNVRKPAMVRLMFRRSRGSALDKHFGKRGTGKCARLPLKHPSSLYVACTVIGSLRCDGPESGGRDQVRASGEEFQNG